MLLDTLKSIRTYTEYSEVKILPAIRVLPGGSDLTLDDLVSDVNRQHIEKLDKLALELNQISLDYDPKVGINAKILVAKLNEFVCTIYGDNPNKEVKRLVNYRDGFHAALNFEVEPA